MTSSAVLARYARALADVAFRQNEEEVVGSELEGYRQIFEAVPGLLDAFDNPAIPREAKRNVLSEVVARYPVRPTTANFLHVLLEHNRIRRFDEVLAAYGKVINERKGIVAARVTAASPVPESDLAALSERLARATGRVVQLSVSTDPDLLGGVVVQIGSTVYDGSVRSRLAELKRRLRGA